MMLIRSFIRHLNSITPLSPVISLNLKKFNHLNFLILNKRSLHNSQNIYKPENSNLLFNDLKSSIFKMAPAPEKYDLIVLGGGSGGLATSKEAAVKYGKKVALVDFVEPTPKGTTWGLGGTCVNVGCIPKKLMHEAALIGDRIDDAHYYGWGQACDGAPLEVSRHNKAGNITHNWETMVERVQNNIKSSNFKYRVELREKQVNYINSFGRFIDPHTIELTNKKGEKSFITGETIIIATGERPKYPTDCEGLEYAITSDDLFSLPYNPGKTLVVGASYVALECAGFLAGLGNDVTVMVRSILLRGFDQEMAEKVGKYMSEHGVRFLRPCLPTKIEQINEGQPGLYRVYATDNVKTVMGEYNTILFAIGRRPCTHNIGLEKAGVKVNPKTGKIPTVHERTNVHHIYAIGDVLEFRAELTPVAIDSGLMLIRRLYGGHKQNFDYVNIPTTVFTPNEYGCVGLTEADAEAKYGQDNIEVFHTYFKPYERGLNEQPVDDCFAKLICVINENMRAVGFHYLGPNAGEVTQFAALALKFKATKKDFDQTVGIHPTCAELFTNLTVTKRSGESPYPRGCCG